DWHVWHAPDGLRAIAATGLGCYTLVRFAVRPPLSKPSRQCIGLYPGKTGDGSDSPASRYGSAGLANLPAIVEYIVLDVDDHQRREYIHRFIHGTRRVRDNQWNHCDRGGPARPLSVGNHSLIHSLHPHHLHLGATVRYGMGNKPKSR